MASKKAFPLRIDPAIYDALRRWADDELRSVNGQIEYLLLQSLKKAGRWSGRGKPPARGPAGGSPPSGPEPDS